MTFFAFFCNLLPIKKNKIVFYNWSDAYGDSPRYIAEAILRHSPNTKLVWVSEQRKAITPARICAFCGKYIMRYHLSTARIIVSNARLGKYFARGFLKKPGQVYLQTWHGVGRMKKIEVDEHHPQSSYWSYAKLDSNNTDILLANSRWGRDILRACFLYSGEVALTGSPRNDVLMNPPHGLADAVRNKLGITKGARIALYVPTHRSRTNVKFEPLSGRSVKSALEKRFGGEWIICIRLHPSTKGRSMRFLLKDKTIRDLSSYPDITELLLVADVLISDYSSCVFDYMLMDKPCFLYVPDQEEYDRDIGLLYKPQTTPCPVSRNNKQLEEKIKIFEYDSYLKRKKEYLTKMGGCDDGNAANRVAQRVLSLLSVPRISDGGKYKKEMLSSCWKGCREFFYSVKVERSKTIKRYRVMGFSFVREVKTIAIAPTPNRQPYYSLPIQENKIVFRSASRGYGCNPKYIAEEIIRRGLPYELVWVLGPYPKQVNVFNFASSFPPNIRLVVAGTDDDEREFATAKLWIDNHCRAMGHVCDYKKKGQFYINTHHGSYGIKKDGPEFHQATEEFLKRRLRDAENIDYLISYGSWITEYYRRVFWNKGNILEVGSPRNDLFFASDEKKAEIRLKVCSKLGIPGDSKIMLYAPSWRPRARREKSFYFLTLDYAQLLKVLKKKWGGNWVIIVRLHQVDFTNSRKALGKSVRLIIDASEYDDMQELLVSADSMISDFSSCIFDYMHSYRPSFLYASDDREYIHEWGLYFPLEDAPFPWAKSNKELFSLIENFDEKQYVKGIDEFLRYQGSANSGCAASRVVDLIESIMPIKAL